MIPLILEGIELTKRKLLASIVERLRSTDMTNGLLFDWNSLFVTESASPFEFAKQQYVKYRNSPLQLQDIEANPLLLSDDNLLMLDFPCA